MNKEQLMKMMVRLLLGAMFLTAAILKLLSIDYFEIYIYSFNIFSFTLTTVVSRLLISVELLLGLGLILKIYYKQVWWLSMLMMVGFTLFLIYVIIFRNDDNCHCFGELVKLNPSESIYKNIVSIVLLLVVRKEDDYKFGTKSKKWIIGISLLVSIILSFVVFPMDTIYNKIVSKNKDINAVAFEEAIKDTRTMSRLYFDKKNDSVVVRHDTLSVIDMSSDRYIVSFISAGCNFCKLGAKKLSMIIENNEIDNRHLKFLVWGYDSDIVEFMNETNTAGYEYWFINPMKSLEITYGKFPTYIWIDDGQIVASGDLRDLEEKMIVGFLK